jgi:drug efflux transport system permease protein
MLRTFVAIARKEMYHILRDTRTLIILFGMPVALVIIFGYTISNEFKNASISVIDQSKDDLSQSFIEHLTSSGHFNLVNAGNKIEDLEHAFKSGAIKMGVIIPPEFQTQYYRDKSATIQIITDATEPNYAATINNYAIRIINTFNKADQSSTTAPYRIDIKTRMFYNPELTGAYNFIPGVAALILMLVSAMMTSLTIAKEKETGTMDLLLVSPLPPLLIILGKVAPYIVLSFIDAIIVFAMGYYIFDVPILGSLPLLLLMSLLYLVVALSLGVFISTKSATQQTAMMASLFALLLPTMLLSGFIFPIASMPVFLQYISKIIPAKYFIEIEKAIMLKGAGWEVIQLSAMVLVIMLFVLLLAAWKNFKIIHK